MNTILGLEINYFTVFIFLIIIFFSFCYLFFYKDTKDKNFQKIIGGLSIFIVAILIENPWVAFTSLFIGGLIIASEKFLKALAAILRTNSDNIHHTLNALNTTSATEEDLEEKEEEIKEIIDEPDLNELDIELNQNERLGSPKKEDIFLKKKKFKDYFSTFYKEKYPEKYRSYVKISNNSNNIVFDGAVINKSGKVKEVFEFKLITKGSLKSMKFIIRRMEQKFMKLGISPHINLFIAAENLKEDDIKDMIIELSWKVNLAIFNIEDAKLKPLFLDERYGETLSNEIALSLLI